MKRSLGIAATISLLLSAPVAARTWYINAAGTGDAPTIEAAADSAVSGDTVLVAAGTYHLDNASVGPGVVLTSESGPYVTRILAPSPSTRVGVGCRAYPLGHAYTEVSGFWFEGYMHINGAGLSISGSATIVHVKNCIFAGSLHGLEANLSAHLYAENCTFFDNTYGLYIALTGADVELSYSIMWDHIFGKENVWTVAVAYRDLSDYLYGYWYLNEDVQFCGEGVGNVYLQSDSPCAPGNHYWDPADVRVIGALPVGCSTVKTEATTWGRLKALYGSDATDRR